MNPYLTWLMWVGALGIVLGIIFSIVGRDGISESGVGGTLWAIALGNRLLDVGCLALFLGFAAAAVLWKRRA